METTNLTNGDSWVERWGAIGLLAFVALAALLMVIRHYLAERRAETARIEREKLTLEKMIEDQRKSLADLNIKLVEVVQKNHTETLELLEAQRADHEEKFTALLDRHIAASDLARERTFELAQSVSKAIRSLSGKLMPEGRDGGGSP